MIFHADDDNANLRYVFVMKLMFSIPHIIRYEVGFDYTKDSLSCRMKRNLNVRFFSHSRYPTLHVISFNVASPLLANN